MKASPQEGRKQAFIATDVEDHRKIDKEINQLPITNSPALPNDKEPLRLPLHIYSQE